MLSAKPLILHSKCLFIYSLMTTSQCDSYAIACVLHISFYIPLFFIGILHYDAYSNTWIESVVTLPNYFDNWNAFNESERQKLVRK